MPTGLEDDSPLNLSPGGSFGKRGQTFTAFKSALSAREIEKARTFLADLPYSLQRFETGQLAVIFREGEPAGMQQ